MTAPRRDLRKLVDNIAARAATSIRIDATLDKSTSATVVTERRGTSAASFTRYSDSAADALEAVLEDAAAWANANCGGARPLIRVDVSEPVDDLVAMVRRLADFILRHHGDIGSVVVRDAHTLLARLDGGQ